MSNVSARMPFLLKGGVVVLIGAAAAALFATAIRPLGHNIPQPQIETDYLAGVFAALVIGLSIFFWPVRDGDRVVLFRLWLAKCAVTLGIMLVYEWQYPLDADAYFEVGASGNQALHQFKFGDGEAIVTRLVSLIASVAPYYHLIKVVFSLVGLIAVYIFYRASVRASGREDLRRLYFLGLFPSVIFWSSILGKDPLQLLAISVYAYGVASWYQTRHWRHILTLAVGILGATAIRIWAGPILLVPLIAIVWSNKISMVLRIAMAIVLAAAILFAWRIFSDQFQIESVEDLRTVAQSLSNGWAGGSAVRRDIAFTGIGSMLSYAPYGMFTTLFRPLPGDVNNFFGLIIGVENAALLMLVIASIRNWRRALAAEPLVRWAFLLLLTWSAVYAFIAYNLGAVARFKLQVLPLMLLVFLHLARYKRLPSGPST
jgi:hypothetical protein